MQAKVELQKELLKQEEKHRLLEFCLKSEEDMNAVQQAYIASIPNYTINLANWIAQAAKKGPQVT